MASVPGGYTAGYKELTASTIPEYYLVIAEIVKKLTDDHESGKYRHLSLTVKYDTEYHYPKEIERSGGVYYCYKITLTPLGENEPETEENEG